MIEEEIINYRYSHTVCITRTIPGRGEEDNPFSDAENIEDETEILYEGEGRSFTDTTTEGNSEVDENKRKASIPVRFDEWEEDKKPTDGDIINVEIGNNKEAGIIYDCESDNNRTLIYWNLRRV